MSCPRLEGVEGTPGEPGAALSCAVETPWEARPGARTIVARAHAFPVGSSMSTRVVCIDARLDPVSVNEVLAREPATIAFPVVSSTGAYVGLVFRRDVELRDPTSSPLSASDIVRTSATVLVESEPFSVAVMALTAHHARFLPVVAEDGASFVGAVTDLDVLRWVVRYR